MSLDSDLKTDPVEPPTFEVRARLGAGGFGEVSLATMRREGTETLVALKRIRADLTDSSTYELQFEREARICAQLDHPHVVKLEAFGTDDTGPFLALEFVHGRPASSLISACERRGTRVPLEVAMSICRDAARGLVYAHQLQVGESRGLIHRDLSPDNVLVSYEGSAKLADFGIARAVDSTRMTTTGGSKGKLGFMSPEILDGRDPSFRSDLFAFAATVYELISGVSPFPGKTEAEIVGRVLKCKPLPLSSHCPVPPAVEAWVMQALKAKPTARPESAAEILLALEAQCVNRPDEGRGDVRRCMRDLWPSESGVPIDDISALATSVRPKRDRLAAKQGRAMRVNRFVGLAVIAAAVLATLGYLLTHGPKFEELPPQKSEIDVLLTEKMERPGLGNKVVVPAPPTKTKIDVRVTTEPAGATVQLEGVKREGHTPLVLEGLRPGQTYHLDLHLPGWFAWSDTFQADGHDVSVKLVKMPVEHR